MREWPKNDLEDVRMRVDELDCFSIPHGHISNARPGQAKGHRRPSSTLEPEPSAQARPSLAAKSFEPVCGRQARRIRIEVHDVDKSNHFTTAFVNSGETWTNSVDSSSSTGMPERD